MDGSGATILGRAGEVDFGPLVLEVSMGETIDLVVDGTGLGSNG